MGARLETAVEPRIDAPAQYVTFMLGGELFAIGILHVKEIIEYGDLTEVPTMPQAIRGVINLRGSVVPVVDLSARFGRSRTNISRRTCILIVEVADDERRYDLGVVVDAVSEVLEMAPGDIEPAPRFGSGVCAHFIAGIGKVNGRFAIILSVNDVLSLDDLASAAGGALQSDSVPHN
ncbi:MAG TPA: chemotaxis protein CheW [Aromatoleum sp.]|uniref:chemotaxis protein CheW n=1 Tax=Aromatoleum sp. TaxID=2307007 RepID=UPI002B49E6EB|nr:chemotaxis protein CheW [Aromatoleum sp.]HJV25004.1 chemotaxis protein CheW [Aromatoleum sp.]